MFCLVKDVHKFGCRPLNTEDLTKGDRYKVTDTYVFDMICIFILRVCKDIRDSGVATRLQAIRYGVRIPARQ